LFLAGLMNDPLDFSTEGGMKVTSRRVRHEG
jgi:hypothetical protein